MTPPNPTPLHVAVIGTGAFGQNHLRVLRALQLEAGGVHLAAAVDPDPGTRSAVAASYAVPVFSSIEGLLASGLSIDAACICTPTVHHAAAALALMAAGIDVLIEKPIAATLAEADTILSVAADTGRIVSVGHLERFNPAVTAVTPRMERPMFFESHRLSIFTPRSLDIDVVLDLMIHDLDIVLQLANSPVREVRAVGLPVLSRKTDIANVRVEFQSGAVANFTASRISTERVRKLRLFQPRQYLSLDFARQDLFTVDVTAPTPRNHPSSEDPAAPGNKTALPGAASGTRSIPATPVILSEAKDPGHLHLAPTAPPLLGNDSSLLFHGRTTGESALPPPNQHIEPAHPTPGLSLRKVETTPGEPLRLEIEDFLEAVRTRNPPRVTAGQARNALALALEINAAITAHAERTGLLP